MRGTFTVAILFVLGFVGSVRADDCCKPPRKVVEFKCVSPCDVFTGVGCYLKNVTCLTVDGVKTVVTAPFKAEYCLPKPQKWIYVKPRLHYERGRFEKVDEPTHYNGFPLVPPEVELGDPVPYDDLPEEKKKYIFPIYRGEPDFAEFVTLYERKF